jgi:hypothetical protein
MHMVGGEAVLLKPTEALQDSWMRGLAFGRRTAPNSMRASAAERDHTDLC